MSVGDRVRVAIPPSTKRRLALRRVQVRRLTSFARPMPSIMVIGTQRGGTSSLYRYLHGHPDLAASIRKETEYFSRRFGEGEAWYRGHFPLSRKRGRHALAFEATPDYLFYPPTPARIAAHLPDARFVVLLRDPVERAYSQYRHMVRLGFEDLSFEDAILREPQRIDADLRALGEDDHYYCRALLRFSYASRGRYADQLERWFALFDRSRFHILRSEDLFRDPSNAFRDIVRFLGVRPWQPRTFRNYGSVPPGATGRMPVGAAELLRDLVHADVDRLEHLLGRSMGWRLGATLREVP